MYLYPIWFSNFIPPEVPAAVLVMLYCTVAKVNGKTVTIRTNDMNIVMYLDIFRSTIIIEIFDVLVYIYTSSIMVAH